jgi:hypothetical protein
VEFLNKQFDGKGLKFSTSVDIEAREVRLGVWRKENGREKEVFSVVEPVQSFVSQLTVTKIILIAG